MFVAQRVGAGVAASLFTAYAVFSLAQLVRGFERFGFDVIVVLLTLYSIAAAVICSWFAFKGHRPDSRRHMRLTFRGGWIVGAIGFVGGFAGPIVFTPESNLGPLLGIFVTGPVGFLLGAAIGWLVGRQ